LRRLAGAGNIIVGTIRARAYDQFRPSDQLRFPEWDVLSVFEHVFISRDLSQKEQERLARAVDDPDVRDRIRTVGLGEYVGAARQVAEALKLGAAGTDPLGYALVQAAADWRRCGMSRPIPVSMLVPLAKLRLDQRDQARLADRDAFGAGLAWATRDINPNVALLQVGGIDSYIVYDYALDLISASDTPIPNSSWAVIMTNADPPELINLGHTASVIYHRDETAAQAWHKAVNSGHADAAPIAAMSLGTLLQEQGDMRSAKDAYQKAIDSGHAAAAAGAAFCLGDLLHEQGDMRSAKDAFQKAIDSGHATLAPGAAVFLGRALLAEQGDVPGA
jgi:tetratricopeptide (TPR) repeat protein